MRSLLAAAGAASLAAAAGLAIGACGGYAGAEAACKASSECKSGLECVAPAPGPSDAGSCQPLGMRCTNSCMSNADCDKGIGGSCSLSICGGGPSYCLYESL